MESKPKKIRTLAELILDGRPTRALRGWECLVWQLGRWKSLDPAAYFHFRYLARRSPGLLTVRLMRRLTVPVDAANA